MIRFVDGETSGKWKADVCAPLRIGLTVMLDSCPSVCIAVRRKVFLWHSRGTNATLRQGAASAISRRKFRPTCDTCHWPHVSHDTLTSAVRDTATPRLRETARCLSLSLSLGSYRKLDRSLISSCCFSP